VEVIVTSGRVRPTDDALPTGVLFIPKPWTADSLAHCIREAVERAQPGGGC
jgi:hypothetical protein